MRTYLCSLSPPLPPGRVSCPPCPCPPEHYCRLRTSTENLGSCVRASTTELEYVDKKKEEVAGKRRRGEGSRRTKDGMGHKVQVGCMRDLIETRRAPALATQHTFAEDVPNRHGFQDRHPAPLLVFNHSLSNFVHSFGN